MGVELLLIIGGLIAQAASEKGEGLYNAGHTAFVIGLVILVVEVLIMLVMLVAGVGLFKRSRPW
jgi:hypothetical protein